MLPKLLFVLIFALGVIFYEKEDTYTPHETTPKPLKRRTIVRPCAPQEEIKQESISNTVTESISNPEEVQVFSQPIVKQDVSASTLDAAPALNAAPTLDAAPTEEKMPVVEFVDPRVEMTGIKNEIEKLISDARTSINTKCSCFVTFDINWDSFPHAEALRKAQYTVDNFKRAMPSFCADDGASIACQIQVVKITYAEDPDISWTPPSATLKINGAIHKTFDDLIPLVRKNN